jgi:putative ABC transport system substrate-binding protein
VDRRSLIGSIVVALVAMPPPSARAQQSAKIWRIGILVVGVDRTTLASAVKHSLQELGHVEGKNVAFFARSADGSVERLPGLVAELVALGVDVIITGGSEATRVAKLATASIPIVFSGPSYPVEEGLVASFARPGGNVTGFTVAMSDTVAKHLELLREVVPTLASVAVIWSPANPGHTFAFRDTQNAAAPSRLKVHSVPMTSADDVDAAIAAIRRLRPDALIVQPAPAVFAEMQRIGELAATLRIPSISILRQFAERGLLMSYGADVRDAPRRVAAYVDRILKGAKPADLPVERPMKFELVINMKTAKALGLMVPRTLLARADEIIE